MAAEARMAPGARAEVPMMAPAFLILAWGVELAEASHIHIKIGNPRARQSDGR